MMTTPRPSCAQRLIALLAIIAMCASSYGGILADEINYMAASKGTASYSVSQYGLVLSGTIDYAVYDTQETGFESPFNADLGNGRYIYAYQIFNDGGENNVAVDYFAVGATDMKVYAIDTEGDITLVDTTDESFSTPNGASQGDAENGITDASAAQFDFDGTLAAGETSYFLIFSSDNAWTTTSLSGGAKGTYATIAGAGLSTNTEFPTPEPATLAIMGLGGFLIRKRRKN